MAGCPNKKERRARLASLLANPDDLLSDIIATVKAGIGLRGWCLNKDVPFSSLYDWVCEDADRKRRYDEARLIGAHSLVEESLAILDADPPRTDAGNIDAAGVNLMKARSDARRWLAGRLLPKQYGDAVSLDVNHTHTVNLRTLLERREQRLKELKIIEGVVLDVPDGAE